METDTVPVANWLEALDAWALEDYDWEPTMRCEYGNHYRQHRVEDPAKYLVRVNASCGCEHIYLMCQSGYDRMVSRATLHCEEHGNGVLFNIKILETIK